MHSENFFFSTTSIQSVLVTEFLAGGDLCERTSAKDYGLTEQKCRTIVRQICRGMFLVELKTVILLSTLFIK